MAKAIKQIDCIIYHSQKYIRNNQFGHSFVIYSNKQIFVINRASKIIIKNNGSIDLMPNNIRLVPLYNYF